MPYNPVTNPYGNMYGAHPYYAVQPQPTPQQTARSVRRPPPQQQYSSLGPPPTSSRHPSPRVTVPRKEKKILEILDPVTKEAVKVDKPEKPASSPELKPATPPQTSAIKIPERTSKPLELVADPADEPDASKKVKTVETNMSEPKPSKKVDTNFSENKQASQTTLPSDNIPSQTTMKDTKQATTSHDTNTVQPPSSDKNVLDSRITSSQQDNITIANGSNPIVNPTSVQATRAPLSTVPDSNKGPDSTAGSVITAEKHSSLKSVPTEEQKSKTATTDSKSDLSANRLAEGISAVSIEDKQVSDDPKSLNTESAKDNKMKVESTAEEKPNKAQTSGEPNAPMRRQRIVFAEGERRVYPPQFMLSMCSSTTASKLTEYDVALSRANISKSGAPPPSGMQGDPRGTRSMRGMSGISGDPRGKRSFSQGGSGFMPVRGQGTQGIMGSGGVGSYDAFDLRSARSQAPPPAPRSHSHHHHHHRGGGDPRLSRYGGRYDGPTRGGHGPIDPFIPHGPVEKLKRSENGWKRDREGDNEVESKVKQVRSLLNKLTLEKFDKILKQIIDIDLNSYEVLNGVVKEVFEKALFEPKFSGMYAQLCQRLDPPTREMLEKAKVLDEQGRQLFFRNILLNNCKEEFTRFAGSGDKAGTIAKGGEEESDENKSKEPKTEKEKKKAKAEADMAATKAKRRMLANVRFIGELFLKGLISEVIIHRQCIQRLLSLGVEKKEEDVLEALCKLLSKTGAKLSANNEAKQYIDRYFQPLNVMSRDHSLPARVRFMLQDLIEQRSNNWKVRREEASAKTIKEIHQDIANEERKKQEQQMAHRSRGRGGSGYRDRMSHNSHNYHPRVAMTMASRPKSGGHMSSASAMIEKHGNRFSGAAQGFQSVRLGPGGRGPRMPTMSGSSGPSLRPGGSKFSALPMMPDIRESSPLQSTGDVRRGAQKRLPTGPRRTPPSRREPESSPLMAPEKLTIRTKNMLAEYWGRISGPAEVKSFLKTDILPPNYPKFIEEALKQSVDAKIEERKSSVSLFCTLISDPISPQLFVDAFTSVIAMLPDLKLDNPKATDFLAVYIGAIAATGKLAEKPRPSFGLDFLKQAIKKLSDRKECVKVVICVLAELYRNLSMMIPDDSERQTTVRNVLTALDIDLAALMNVWNPMRGTEYLRDLLKDGGVSFLLQTLDLELELKKVLNDSTTSDDVLAVLNGPNASTEVVQSQELMKMVVRVSFDWLFMNPPESISTKFTDVIGKVLVARVKPSNNESLQMAAVLATQFFISANIEVLPPHTEGDADKPGHIAFQALYDADVVEEEVLLKWKDDTGRSQDTEGKEKMLMQTSRFFKWLAEAEEEG